MSRKFHGPPEPLTVTQGIDTTVYLEISLFISPRGTPTNLSPTSFTGQVKLHSILVRTSPASSAPATLRVFQNRENLDFSAAEDQEPDQEFELSQTSEVQELPVKRAKFARVRRLALFFPDNFAQVQGEDDEEATRVSYLGFKGEWMQLGRAPTNILYEAAANPGDHKIKGTNVNQMGSGIGGRGPGV